MRKFLEGLTTSDIELVQITPTDIERAHRVLEQYADSELDFVDSTIVAIAERRDITRILTLDRRDFSIIRPLHCEYFEIFP